MPLRVAAKRGADGTIEYGMGFDEPLDTDTRVVTNGIEVVVAPTSAPLLDGLVLDFVRLDDGDEQFVFLNPNDASEG